MYELKKISPKSAAKVLSFVFAIFYIIGGVVSVFWPGNDISRGNAALTVAAGAVIAYVSGIVLGLLAAVIYNWSTRHRGGLVIEFELIEDEAGVKHGHRHHSADSLHEDSHA